MASGSEQHSEATRLEWLDGEVALLVLDQPDRSANILCEAVLNEFQARLDEVDARPGARGLVITSAKPGVFIAGADLTEFQASLDLPPQEVVELSRRGQQLFGRLASSSYVTVAAIDGICVGGGAEMATWCDRRVLSDSSKTAIGFPEVKLGLFPGWGGTARASRMLGLANAVEMVTGGENVSAEDALKMGLADEVVSGLCNGNGEEYSRFTPNNSRLVVAAQHMVEAEQASGDWKRDRKRWSAPIQQSETELGFLGATASAVIQQKTSGFYPAPNAALELLLEASQLDLEGALAAEAEAFAPLFGSPVNRALLNVFFLTDRAKKVGGGDSEVKSATVIGAGIMGQGIAAANVKRGVSVLLSDNRPEALAKGVEGVVREASFNKKTRAIDADLAIERGALINAATEPARLAQCDVVIEAVVELIEVKKQIFASLDAHTTEHTVLCSNTSTIPISALAEGLSHPERFCGLHFFNPVRKMPLVEVIRGQKTSDSTIDAMAAYAKKLGKTPVIVNDGPGFLVNRLLLPYMNEAALAASEGTPIKEIEKTAKRFGMPMGPLELHDVVGLDTCVHAGKVLLEAFSDRVEPAPILAKLVDAERFGQKNLKGFFDYKPGKPGKPPKSSPSDEVAAMIQSIGLKPKVEGANLTDRLMLSMLVEATRAIEDGIVSDVRDVDLALIYGIGFPPHRGGLFHWADSLGADKILAKLEPLATLGKRFEPTAMLTEAARSGAKFYSIK